MPSVLSAQSPAYRSFPRVNKPLGNVWILQEAVQDQSSGKVMRWDCGAVRPAGMLMPYQTQLGHVGLKCAGVAMGTSFCRARSRGSPGSHWGQVVPVGPCLCPAFAPGRPWQSPRGGRRCPAEEGGEQELASERPHLCPTGSHRPFRAACRPSPAARHHIPCPAWEQGAEGRAVRGPAPPGP